MANGWNPEWGVRLEDLIFVHGSGILGHGNMSFSSIWNGLTKSARSSWQIIISSSSGQLKCKNAVLSMSEARTWQKKQLAKPDQDQDQREWESPSPIFFLTFWWKSACEEVGTLCQNSTTTGVCRQTKQCQTRNSQAAHRWLLKQDKAPWKFVDNDKKICSLRQSSFVLVCENLMLASENFKGSETSWILVDASCLVVVHPGAKSHWAANHLLNSHHCSLTREVNIIDWTRWLNEEEEGGGGGDPSLFIFHFLVAAALSAKG